MHNGIGDLVQTIEHSGSVHRFFTMGEEMQERFNHSLGYEHCRGRMLVYD